LPTFATPKRGEAYLAVLDQMNEDHLKARRINDELTKREFEVHRKWTALIKENELL